MLCSLTHSWKKTKEKQRVNQIQHYGLSHRKKMILQLDSSALHVALVIFWNEPSVLFLNSRNLLKAPCI